MEAGLSPDAVFTPYSPWNQDRDLLVINPLQRSGRPAAMAILALEETLNAVGLITTRPLPILALPTKDKAHVLTAGTLIGALEQGSQ